MLIRPQRLLGPLPRDNRTTPSPRAPASLFSTQTFQKRMSRETCDGVAARMSAPTPQTSARHLPGPRKAWVFGRIPVLQSRTRLRDQGHHSRIDSAESRPLFKSGLIQANFKSVETRKLSGWVRWGTKITQNGDRFFWVCWGCPQWARPIRPQSNLRPRAAVTRIAVSGISSFLGRPLPCGEIDRGPFSGFLSSFSLPKLSPLPSLCGSAPLPQGCA